MPPIAADRNAYDLAPETRVAGHDDEAWEGAAALAELARRAASARAVCAECYPATDERTVADVIAAVGADLVVRGEDALLDADALTAAMRPHLTDDRVRGVMYHGPLEDFADPERLPALRARVAAALAAGRRVLAVGTGASLVLPEPDLLVYCDLARWEIQLRYRAGAPNLKQANFEEDVLRKVKRGYFVEWRVADRKKAELLPRADLVLDGNDPACPRLATGSAVRDGLAQLARRPFRLVPYFDPGVWGGHWMQERFGLDPEQPNFAWAFDGVPEENSLYLRLGDVRLELPAMDLTLMQSRALLGEAVFARFGAEFPIRFDFLDTMGGQNLSLQVHPDTDYCLRRFGMAYTQDESYYILDAGEGAGVYLGLREGVDPAAMMGDLRAAQRGEKDFDAGRYVNRFEAHKHDHFLIPAGTVHCSAANTVVLEISATPYNFTFKMWDWGRVGLDGLPRPIHLDDAERVVRWDRTTAWCERELVNDVHEVASGPGWREERTGLHELEFIETRRFWAEAPTEHDASAGVHVLNLVEGGPAVVESPEGAFEPLVVHYAETFVVPAGAGRYRVRPVEAGERIGFVKAYVRAR